MIDTKELRSMVNGAQFESFANSVINALLDRLEAAEKAVTEAYQRGYATGQEEIAAELEFAKREVADLHDDISEWMDKRDALRAKIKAMEQQEPVAYLYEYVSPMDGKTPVWRAGRGEWNGQQAKSAKPLYALPGAQPAPSEKDEPIRKAWARFSNELHRSPDAPYPGMSEAFEQHFSQSFTDRDWRAESATWAAAWKAAKRHEAPPAPSIPEGWLRAINEDIGVANADDTYEQARAKLDSLIGFHVDIATDPTMNGGYKLVPIEPTPEMLDAGEDTFVPTYTGTPVSALIDVYRAMLAAAPEALPGAQGEEK